MSNDTVIAFDFGTKNIGSAIGHKMIGIAHPFCSLRAYQGSPNWSKIENILKEWQINLVIVGLPLNIDGTEQLITAQARKFANRIHGRFGVDIILHDERFSTIEAKSYIITDDNNISYRFLDKNIINNISAVIILKSWFEHYLKKI
ncbi:Putative pre-16S rRNA nuclease [Candidatus Profftia lariciata]|uniref:Holliday junction resolvase RuvX n=1 Tax=Candidatus Profftia lariciata TaxID=1987921 RepID=UPI001D02F853|nr:Holliday junction resolvase RuvX [Candidatus Profftia lariciata]UDG81684.1 Putative pre-16S rRNA nuclease [Candidatus Profftia lariciata]